MKFYNTLKRKKEDFIPIKKGEVKIYSCGPTVYFTPHIGNLRAALFVDVLKRVLRYYKFKIYDVVNVTDVGHLVSDEDAGEDKMLKASKRENKDPYEIARYYEEIYIDNLKKLNIILPKYMPRATENIVEQIKVIQELENNGFTYKTSDGIYFDVSKFKEYGKLSGQSLDEKKAGARVKLDDEKKNPQDFALWKFAVGDNKNHIMKWDSPWGEGFPGWHIECTAMSNKYLGENFDIHTGGIDHIPVHHENEIAQNTCSKAIKNINFWMHNDFFTVDNGKMSKSLGNTYTLQDLIDKGYSPLALREVCLRTHYRKKANFTFESLDAGENNLKKINDFYTKFKEIKIDENLDSCLTKIPEKYLDKFEDAIKDDLNTPLALAAVYEFMTEINRKQLFSLCDKEEILNFMERTDIVLGLLENKGEIPQEILKLAQERKIARDKKDWKKSDELRDKIKLLGYDIKDTKDTKEAYILNIIK
ncbi:MAG: cysteine--tRNA ligase [Nanoarchaeota archaeon]|nr:cysteine--tRNA ligase [Nanoarchaeota archaeon]